MSKPDAKYLKMKYHKSEGESCPHWDLARSSGGGQIGDNKELKTKKTEINRANGNQSDSVHT